MAEEMKTTPVPEEQKPEPPAPEVPGTPPVPEQGSQVVLPGMEGPPPPGNKVIDLSSARAGAGPEQQAAPAPEGGQEWEKPQEEEKKPRRGRPPKDKEAPAQGDKPKRKGRPPKAEKQAPGGGGPGKSAKAPRQSKPGPAKEDPAPPPPAPEQPPQLKDASRGKKEEIVYLDLDQLHPFQNHPFGVRDDVEMQGLVSSVKAGGVHQPALVRPREGGGYEIVAGHRRQRASELAGLRNMPCIVREMTDDEAVLAMTDDNLRHREKILPMEKAQSLKMQVEAISHQGSKLEGVAAGDVGKRSTEIVGERNGMNYKQVQRYIRLTELVPELQSMVNEKKLSFTPAVEISFIKPKNQRFIAVSIEGEQASPSLSQAQELRKLDKDGKLNGDVIDGILSREKKEVDKVIISAAELNKYFGKDTTPREMKDQIMSLLDAWKEKQPPERTAPEKKTDREK